MFRLDDKCALVTGASGGIGGAIAKVLHASGASVALSGTRTEALESLAGELGERCAVTPCDLGDGEQVAAVWIHDMTKIPEVDAQGTSLQSWSKEKAAEVKKQAS